MFLPAAGGLAARAAALGSRVLERVTRRPTSANERHGNDPPRGVAFSRPGRAEALLMLSWALDSGNTTLEPYHLVTLSMIRLFGVLTPKR